MKLFLKKIQALSILLVLCCVSTAVNAAWFSGKNNPMEKSTMRKGTPSAKTMSDYKERLEARARERSQWEQKREANLTKRQQGSTEKYSGETFSLTERLKQQNEAQEARFKKIGQTITSAPGKAAGWVKGKYEQAKERFGSKPQPQQQASKSLTQRVKDLFK